MADKDVVDLVLSGNKPRLISEDEDEMPSIITSEDSTEEVLFKIGSHVRRIGNRIDGIDSRLEAIERNGHPCTQAQRFHKLEEESKEWRQDKEQGIKTRVMVQTIAEDVGESKQQLEKLREGQESEARDRRKSGTRSLMAVGVAAIGVVAAIVGGAWTIRGEISQVENAYVGEKTLRDQQYGQLKRRLDLLPTKEQVASKEQVTDIQRNLDNEFIKRCGKLSDTEKQRLAHSVRAGHLPPQFLCP